MRSSIRAFLSTVVFSLALAAGAQAQNVAGKWHVDFGAWANEDQPGATIKFVQTGKLTVEVKGDSLVATFLPEYENAPANAGAPVRADTLRGTFASGKLRLTGKRATKVRQIQNGEDTGEQREVTMGLEMDLALTADEFAGTMKMEIAGERRFVAPMKVKRES